MFCGNCGKELKEGTLFCGGCGCAVKKEEPEVLVAEENPAEIIKEIEAEVEMEKFQEPVKEKFCPNCGKKLPEEALFCGGCGYSYTAGISPEPVKTPAPKPVTPKKKGKGGIVAIIIVLILAVAGVGGWYAYDNGYLDFIFAEDKDDDKKDKDRKNKGSGEDIEYCSDCGEEKIELDGDMLCPQCDVIIEREERDEEDEENLIDEEVIDDQSEYLFPSDRELITEDDLAGLSKEQVALIRNEIYARHGYIFQSEVYQEYFGKKEWYTPDQNFTADRLNAIETANKDFLVQYETDMGWR